MPPTEHRITHPQPPHTRLATKANLAQLEVKLYGKITHLETKLIRWMIGIGIALASLNLSPIIYLS